MKFKQWFENLAGPGGGPEPNSDSTEQRARDDQGHGVGAFPSYGDNPPRIKTKSPTAGYLDPRYAGKKWMKKDVGMAKTARSYSSSSSSSS